MARIDLIRGGYAFSYVYTEDGRDSVDVYDSEELETAMCRVRDVTPGQIRRMGQEDYESFLYEHLSG